MRRNIFADKASLVLRRMLREPGRRWVVRDFVGTDGVSLGLAQNVLEAVETLGYAEKTRKGPASFTLLTNPELLIAEWVKAYSVSRNEIRTFYLPYLSGRDQENQERSRRAPLCVHSSCGSEFSYLLGKN
ncbi:MAG: hypothetical protein A2Y69_13375 [Candidatus Aminicenantes bacterium RBG_13_59_9]|nr:MAG: hypothetical protein A2Y69_13375 [Candidatus Aminicenantes bacterium RBG_13_59_9]